MKIGAQVVWISDCDSPEAMQLGRITALPKDGYVQVNRQWISEGFVFPASAQHALREVLEERRRLKRALDDSMMLVYQLRNKVAKGEYPYE